MFREEFLKPKDFDSQEDVIDPSNVDLRQTFELKVPLTPKLPVAKAREAIVPLKNYILGFDSNNLWKSDDENEAFLRFKNGAWNRQHINPVTVILKEYAFKENSATAQEVLSGLQKELLREAKELNPQGHLAKCIKKIQAETNNSLIDINNLNWLIRKKKLKEELNEGDGYWDALKILREYYGHQPEENLAPFARFFKGAWNRKNIKAVATVVNMHQNIEIILSSTEEGVYRLLSDLKKQLVQEGKEINPNGDLAKCIEEIQLKNDVKVINIQGLNLEIKRGRGGRSLYTL
jgi:hypothetical protein